MDDITYEVSGAVATLTICRQHKRNALARKHFARLAALMRRADEDGSIRVVVLTGEGSLAFCAGADLSADETFLEDLASDRTTGLGDYLRQTCLLPKPRVARINGHCYAGGMGLLASCDLVVTCDDARFALPEINLGIFPFVVLAALEDRIAHGHAMQLALSGAAISADRAFEIGLVSHKVPRSELDAAVETIVAGLAMHSASATAFGLLHARRADTAGYLSRITKAEALSRELASSREGN
ncbi:enoyl-CoA hydratase/isomerase family protein [Rhizobium sp. SGZ-381]|uniref:enoyl-CoA hydratase/isomerase family protein n=1 Tax=Rhizobium sp. SGZ-381 TaxID=3342800 RepID=UPI00366E03C5